ncbi:DUF1016 family protein [Candidatus Poribacteria bacterium]|nr:DUF1016 family protein [Candidatus Poribacteria bacterium]
MTDDKTLFREIRELILSARNTVVRNVDTIQVITCFEIGRRIVEHEQQGENRAQYGKALLKELSCRLTKEFGRGFSERNLDYMRKFYLLYKNRIVKISQMMSAKLIEGEKTQIVSGKSKEIQQMESAKSLKSAFPLSWSQYVFLIGKLTHQDLGQMQMYVNYFDRYVKTEQENSTIGIILCRKNREALVEITLPKDANIHASS